MSLRDRPNASWNFPVPTATNICEAYESLNAGSGRSRALRADGSMIFSGGGRLLSNLSIDASSASNDAFMPNDTMQQTCITRMLAFTGADYKESCYKTKRKMLAGPLANW